MIKSRPEFRPCCLALLVLACGLLLPGCAAKHEPLLGFDYWRLRDGNLEGRKLSCSVSEVDDLGDVWVVNSFTLKNGRFSPVLRAEWQNLDGHAEADLTRFLENGPNYVIFTLFNKVYKGWSPMGSGGKFRCNFQLFLDNKVVYRVKHYRDYNEKRLIFAVIFKVDALSDNRLRLTPLTEEERYKAMDVVQTSITKILYETSDEANIDWSAGGARVIVQDPEVKKAVEALRDLGRSR